MKQPDFFQELTSQAVSKSAALRKTDPAKSASTPITVSLRATAPLTKLEVQQLRADIRNIEAAAKRKGVDLDPYTKGKEIQLATAHFDLGCWLYYLQPKIGKDTPEGFTARILCALHLFLRGIRNPSYDFFTIFNFGARDYDTLFEMGDSASLIEALRPSLELDKSGHLLDAFKHYNWPTTAEAPAGLTH